MKDFTFSDVNDSDSIVVFSTDLINGDAFTIHAIEGLDESTLGVGHPKKKALLAFQKRNYTKQDFIQFAQDEGLRLTMADSDGSNLVVLVDDDSDSDAASW